MTKKHFFLLIILLAAVFTVEAKVVDTHDFSITVPDGWQSETSEMGYPISSMLSISNAAETEMLLIAVYQVDVDPQSFLQQQVVEGTNQFFASASYVGEIRDERLGGERVKAVEFQTKVAGMDSRGTAYAGGVSSGMCFVFYACKTGTTSRSRSILTTLKFKSNVDVENKSLAERLNDFSALIAKHPVRIGDNIMQTGFVANNATKTITYVYSMDDFSADKETAAYMQTYMEGAIAEAFKEDFDTSSLVREAAEAGYTFKYKGVDKDGRQVYLVKVTPADYEHLLH